MILLSKGEWLPLLYFFLSGGYPAGKYWSPERLNDVPLQRRQDVP